MASYQLGAFEEALGLYKQALALCPAAPKYHFNAGQCHRGLKDWRMARFHYKHYLAGWQKQNPGRPAPPVVLKLLSEVERELRSVRGRLVLHGLPDGAAILVDGVVQARAPLSAALELEPGAHVVRVEAAQHDPWTRTITVQAGATAELRAALRRSLPPASAPARRRYVEQVMQRSTPWLVAGLASATVAAGLGVVGIVYQVEANDSLPGDAFERARATSISGYVLAGVFAAFSGLSFYLWYQSGGPTGAVLPTSGGAVAVGSIQF